MLESTVQSDSHFDSETLEGIELKTLLNVKLHEQCLILNSQISSFEFLVLLRKLSKIISVFYLFPGVFTHGLVQQVKAMDVFQKL